MGEGVFVHERALCESDSVGAGTRIWAFAHVQAGASIGRGCNVGDHAFIEKGARLGDGVVVKNGVHVWDGVALDDAVFAGPGVCFTNDLHPRAAREQRGLDGWTLTRTRVGRGASLGAGAVIVCGITIGPSALIGAGAVVTRDVPAHALMVGNPARRVGWVCECARRLDAWLACICGRRYRESEQAPGLESL